MTASTSAGMNAVDVYAGELRDAEDAVGRCFDVNEDMARVIAVAAEGAAAAIERCDGFGRDGFGRGRCGRRSQHANQYAIPFIICKRFFYGRWLLRIRILIWDGAQNSTNNHLGQEVQIASKLGGHMMGMRC